MEHSNSSINEETAIVGDKDRYVSVAYCETKIFIHYAHMAVDIWPKRIMVVK